MSFSEDIKKELIEIQIKKNCCKKAFLLGLLINSTKNNNSFTVYNIVEEISDKIEELLTKQFSAKCQRNVKIKPGKKYYGVAFSSRALSSVFDDINSEPDGIIQDAVGFNCQACEQAFLRGAFLACAKINDPQKGYQLEFSLSRENITVASKFYRFLSMMGFVPKITNRKNSYCI